MGGNAIHFVGLLPWIPINKAMFTGDHHSNRDELENYALAAVRVFLAAYAQPQAGSKLLRNNESPNGSFAPRP